MSKKQRGAKAAKTMEARLTIRLDATIEKGLAALAIREDRTVADVARRLLRLGFETYLPEARAPKVPSDEAIEAMLRTPKPPTP